MAALSNVSSTGLLPAAAPSTTKTQDQVLEELMNDFLEEEAKSQPAASPLGTTHAVEPIVKEDDSEEILKQCLESFDPERIDLQQMMQQSIKLMDIQLRNANKFFAELVAQPKESLTSWLANQDKMRVQGFFLASKQVKTALESLMGGTIKPMISPDILKEWTVNYPLAVLKIQEQPELQKYIPTDSEVQELMSEMFCSTGPMKASLEKAMQIATAFFEKFLAIQDDEEAKTWLAVQRNKKDPKDPECYPYPFSETLSLVQLLEQKPDLKDNLDLVLLKRCLTGLDECGKRLKSIGLENVLDEVHPLIQEKMQLEFTSILSFFKDLLSQLKKEPADPERMKKWIEEQNTFKLHPFVVGKGLVIENYENAPVEFRSTTKEIGGLYAECVPLLKSLGLESYLKIDPKSTPLGMTQHQIEKFNSRDP